MTKKVIKVLEFANGAPCPIVGQYLKSFDFEAGNGRGYGTFTDDRTKAMVFPGFVEAMSFWRTRSKTKPTRSDGRPNRPFTSTSVEIVDA